MKQSSTTILVIGIVLIILLTIIRRRIDENSYESDFVLCDSQENGLGLCANKSLPKGYKLGRLSLIHPQKGHRISLRGSAVNQSANPTLNAMVIPQKNGIFAVVGVLNSDLKKGDELTIDYKNSRVPEPKQSFEIKKHKEW